MITGKTLFILSFDSSIYFGDGTEVYFVRAGLRQGNRHRMNASNVQNMLPPLGVRLFPLERNYASLNELAKNIPVLHEIYPDSLSFDTAGQTFAFRWASADTDYPWNDNSFSMQAVATENGMVNRWSGNNFSAMSGEYSTEIITISKYEFNKMNYTRLRNEIDSLKKFIPESPKAIPLWFSGMISQVSQEDYMPDFELESGEETRKRLYEFSGDSIRLIVFWVGGVKKTTEFFEIMSQFDEGGRIALLINPEGTPSWGNGEELLPPSQQYRCNIEVPQRMGISYYPAMFLVDKDFRVIAMRTGYPENVEELRNWIDTESHRN